MLTGFSRLLITVMIFVTIYYIISIAFCSEVPKMQVGPVDKRTSYEKIKDEVKDEVSKILVARAKKSVLIADYLNLDNEQDKFGKYLAEDFSALFSRNYRGFRVIDRSRLNMLLEEQNLNAAGLLDQRTVSTLGKIIGVEAVVTGKYQIVGDYVKLWIKVIDIEKSELLMTKEVKILLEGELKDASEIGSWW